MSNMSLEDKLNLLAQWGKIQLTRPKFVVGASPHLKGKPVLWRCEVSIPGYVMDGSWINPSFKSEDASVEKAVDDCYNQVEAYRASQDSHEDRQRYVDKHERDVERFENARPDQLYGIDPIRKPRDLLPDTLRGELPPLCEETVL